MENKKIHGLIVSGGIILIVLLFFIIEINNVYYDIVKFIEERNTVATPAPEYQTRPTMKPIELCEGEEVLVYIEDIYEDCIVTSSYHNNQEFRFYTDENTKLYIDSEDLNKDGKTMADVQTDWNMLKKGTLVRVKVAKVIDGEDGYIAEDFVVVEAVRVYGN